MPTMTSPLTPATRVASSFNDEYVPGVAHASSADRELKQLSERWGAENAG
jgi:hypothetical protein